LPRTYIDGCSRCLPSSKLVEPDDGHGSASRRERQDESELTPGARLDGLAVRGSIRAWSSTPSTESASLRLGSPAKTGVRPGRDSRSCVPPLEEASFLRVQCFARRSMRRPSLKGPKAVRLLEEGDRHFASRSPWSGRGRGRDFLGASVRKPRVRHSTASRSDSPRSRRTQRPFSRSPRSRSRIGIRRRTRSARSWRMGLGGVVLA